MLKIGPNLSAKPMQKQSFGAARVNIMAMSDSHGQVEKLPDLYEAVHAKKDEVFDAPGSDGKAPRGSLNMFVHSGDWFINPGKKGFMGAPDKTAAEFQVDFMNGLMKELKTIAGSDMKSFYTPGNHCMDDGDKFILKTLAKAEPTTLLTNINMDKSPSITSMDAKSRDKFKEGQVIEVADDKNPNKKHKVLMLGMTTPSLDFYDPGQVKGLDVVDRNAIKDIQLRESHFQNTYDKLNKKISAFKQENPQGAVVLLSHNGNNVANMIVQNVDGIDVIVNGHDHKKTSKVLTSQKTGKKTLVTSLYQNNDKFSSIKLHFNDNGDLDNVKEKGYYPSEVNKEAGHVGLKDNPMQKQLVSLLGEDFKPSIFVSGPSEIKQMSTQGIRKQNSHLMNFVADSVKEEYETHDPDVDIVGYQSASIRQPIAVNGWTSNIKLLNLFCGRPLEGGILCKGEITGADFTRILTENYGDNLKNNSRNPLLHYSGVRVNKKGVDELLMSGGKVTNDDYAKNIEVKDKNGEYKPLDLNKTYKVVMPKECFIVPNVRSAMALYPSKFKDTPYNGDDLFMDFVKRHDYKMDMTKSADTRIVS